MKQGNSLAMKLERVSFFSLSRSAIWLGCKKYADEVIYMKKQLPKNVRQIGNVSDSSKIYIEDYVDTFFNQLCEKTDHAIKGAFLVGEMTQEKGEDYIYIYGAIQMKDVGQKGKDIFISDNTWKKGCEMCKRYFGDGEILGWFLATEGQAFEVNHNTLKVHQKFFPREKSVFAIKETREKDEKYYIYKYRELMESAGHYVYYEKNAEMQEYMIAMRKQIGMTPSEVIDDTAAKNFRSVIREKMEKNEKKTHFRLTYAFSAILVLLVLVIGVTMMNNYDKMKGMQTGLEKLNGDAVEKDDVAMETIGNIIQMGEALELDNTSEETKQEETKQENDQEETSKPEKTESNQETPKDKEEKREEYIVQKGDTLASISKKMYGDSSHVDSICEVNGLKDGNLILVGQKLLLP